MYGSVHIVMMSTEYDFRSSSKQYSDLANMLAGVNRSITPWLIFSGHRWVAVSSFILQKNFMERNSLGKTQLSQVINLLFCIHVFSSSQK